MSNNTIVIDYYTDVLCVWAWIAQRRIDELKDYFDDKIILRYHYMDVFGDTAKKMHTQWASKGSYQGFAEHVQKSAAGFDSAPINPKIWNDIRPATSANAHMVLKAVEFAYDRQASIDLALKIRKAFFIDAKDIGDLNVLCGLVKEQGLNTEPVNQSINSGKAMALLMGDYQQAKQQSIKGSPSYVMDNDRQTLYGNVGYRVLQANIEELLKNPADEASWC